MESRTRPSCRTWVPWHGCRFLHGWQRPSSTAAWWLLQSEPKSGCRGRPATCAAWPPSAWALAPPTPSCRPTLPPRSGGTRMISCRHLLPHLPHLHTETVPACSFTPPPLCLPLRRLKTQKLTADSTLKNIDHGMFSFLWHCLILVLRFYPNIHSHATFEPSKQLDLLL